MNQTASVSHQIDCQPSKDSKEFVDVSPPQRNWKGIAISLLVIVVVCSLISMSVVVLTPAELPGNGKSKLTVEDLYKPEFSLHDPEAMWVSDSEVIYRNQDGHVIKFDFVLNETEVILTNSTFVAFKVMKYSLSADLKFALFAYDVKPMYRYSYTASYIVYNIHTREVWELNPPEVHDAVLQHAAWGRRGQQLIYIFENNIYYQSDVRSTSLRITSSGVEGVIFNGLSDWLYEEEVLRSHVAHWWSPSGERLAFLTINDSLVPNMALPQFTGSTYPRGLQYPYPMAGQRNPAVKLNVVNLLGPTHTQELQPPRQLRDFYITMVTWLSNTHLAVRWINRPQNNSLLTVCDSITGVCLQRHEESSGAWISRQNQEPLFSKDRSRFFLTLPVKQGGQGDFHHISMFSRKDKVRHLTSGDWEVTEIVAYDESNNTSFTLLCVFSVSTLGLFPRRCMTCGLRDGCSFFDADVNTNARHAILCGYGFTVFYWLWLTWCSLCFLTELPLRLSFPPDFSESLLYSLLLILDGAPGQQAVSDEFQLTWDQVLASSEQVIVARLDGRGSGFRGQRVLQDIHHRLGTVDVNDQMAALGYVNVIGYGGFLSLMMLKSTDRLIRCAAVQAPIIDWTLYGKSTAFITSDILTLPVTTSKVLPNMNGVHDGTLFVAHGTADANVHFQHSAELIKHLIKARANYTMQVEQVFLITFLHCALESLLNS
uniref:Inactive dipeptidyl peptidase 10-like n=1 Tax=Gouania willdenowi TaxID=441366 RepID=A0A8C5DGS0_GOUWI